MRRILIIVVLLATILLILKCTSKEAASSYTIARDATWWPLSLLDKETSMLAFSDELLTTIASEEKISIYTVTAHYSNLFFGLDNEEYDGILTSLLPSPNAQSKYAVSDTYFLLGPVLIVNAKSTATSLSAMENKLVGILRNSSLVFDTEKYPSIVVIPYDTASAALDNLAKDNIDGVIMDVLPAYHYVQKYYAGRLKVATPPLTKKGLRLITRKDSRSLHLIEKFNEGLQRAKANGKYDELIKRWELESR